MPLHGLREGSLLSEQDQIFQRFPGVPLVAEVSSEPSLELPVSTVEPQSPTLGLHACKSEYWLLWDRYYVSRTYFGLFGTQG